MGKAFDTVETSSLSAQVAKSKSPHIYMAFTLARNAGLRDTEIKTLTWAQINLTGRYLTVGRAKTEAGEGRTIPFNDELYETLRPAPGAIQGQVRLNPAGVVCVSIWPHTFVRPNPACHHTQNRLEHCAPKCRRRPADGTITGTR